MLAMFGGGNGEGVVADYDADLAPAMTYVVTVEAETVAQIEATPTPAAIASTGIGGQPGSGSQVVQAPATEVASSNLAPSLATGCPAVIVETFGENAPAACAVAWCESRWSTWAIGDAGASLGLFQVQPRWHQWRVPGEDLHDPEVNTRAAWLISSGGTDWSAWTCKPW